MATRSSRIPIRLTSNRLARAREAVSPAPFDLTVSNPTACGFPYEAEWLTPLSDPHGLSYMPDPRGASVAREAVARWYRRWQVEVEPDHVVLTSSTSEAYSFLFRLLADPGEAVLFPSPSYPLFDALSRLDGIASTPYPLVAEDAWRPALDAIEAAPESVRAMVVVHPNNPTGSYVHPNDAAALRRLCRQRRWALIADEVFLPFPLSDAPGSELSFAGTDDCLCFTLGGLSKSVGMPQVKLSWIVVGGPEEQVADALDGLDFVADSFLSVSTPVALATPTLLESGGAVTRAIRDRCTVNLVALERACSKTSTVDLLPPQGGWTAVLRVPSVVDEEDLAVDLLVKHGVAVHPGYFFDFASDGHLVISLLTRPAAFAEGVRRVLAHVEQSCR